MSFVKKFKNTYFAEHLQRTASNDMDITRFFCKNVCSLKRELKGYQR